jgi:hypothetical protein
MPRPSEVDIEELADTEELAETSEVAPKSYFGNYLEPADDTPANGTYRTERGPFESRRLGVRAPASFSLFVNRRGKRIRARAAEVSTTGVLVDFRYSEPCAFDGLVTLELAVPGLTKPIRCAARFARYVGRLQAFEFMIIGRDDRLSLAEYIDRAARPPLH